MVVDSKSEFCVVIYYIYIYIYAYIYSVSFHNCPRLIPFCTFYDYFMSFVNQRYYIMLTVVEIGPSNALQG